MFNMPIPKHPGQENDGKDKNKEQGQTEDGKDDKQHSNP